MRFRTLLFLLVMTLLLGACASPPEIPTPTSFVEPTIAPSATVQVVDTATSVVATEDDVTPLPTEEKLPTELPQDPADWESWPEIPVVTEQMRDVYLLGQSLGNDPHAFSIFGDCQSVPESFFGIYEEDEAEVAKLPANLQERVTYFEGSFNRESPTVKDGTTSGALLWIEWHENKYSCKDDETPVDCELRIHNPSFVIIAVGTHWEDNRMIYMRKIIEELLEKGVVPILATKADNREGDYKVNVDVATLAKEYNLPLWNFWLVTKDLPNQGLYTKKIDAQLGDIYLTEEALALRRYSALEVLDAVWLAVAGE